MLPSAHIWRIYLRYFLFHTVVCLSCIASDFFRQHAPGGLLGLLINLVSTTTATLSSRLIRVLRPAIRGNPAAVLYMSRYPSRYRGAYDYNYAYGEYDFSDRGAWSSPEYAYDEYDPRAGREPWQSPTSSNVQSAYADYYSEPRDCYSAPSSSQPTVSHDHRGDTLRARDEEPTYQGMEISLLV